MHAAAFAVGRHRPVYFWAGPATVRMNRLKFMDAPVNEAINCNHFEFGVDLRQAACISDVVMIEDHSLPHLASDGTPVVNAITCKAARAWSGDTPPPFKTAIPMARRSHVGVLPPRARGRVGHVIDEE